MTIRLSDRTEKVLRGSQMNWVSAGPPDEDSPELDSVLDSGSSLHPGEMRLLTASLDPGHYVMVCNLPGHYNAGMRVDITVK